MEHEKVCSTGMVNYSIDKQQIPIKKPSCGKITNKNQFDEELSEMVNSEPVHQTDSFSFVQPRFTVRVITTDDKNSNNVDTAAGGSKPFEFPSQIYDQMEEGKIKIIKLTM